MTCTVRWLRRAGGAIIGSIFALVIGISSAQAQVKVKGSPKEFSEEGQAVFVSFSKGFVCAFTPKDCKEKFVKELLAELGSKYPQHNIMICATHIGCNWHREPKTYMYKKHDYNYTAFGNVSYFVWTFTQSDGKGAHFERVGDGGFLNWGFRGVFDRQDAHVYFK